jgi:predicted molibdopterin-dependent oxidoreductase YjgC
VTTTSGRPAVAALQPVAEQHAHHGVDQTVPNHMRSPAGLGARAGDRVGIDASHPLFAIDHNRCVLCTRCVRVCDEIEGAHTWDVMGRGIDARVVTDLGTPWGESPTCTSCGKCVQVCPTGALFEKGRSVAEGAKTRRPFLPYLRRPGEGSDQ